MRVAFRFDTGLDARLLIARVTGAPVHCCVVYDDDWCSDVGFEGLRLMPLTDRIRTGTWQVWQPRVPLNDAAGRALAVSRIGWHYDWLGAMASWYLGRIGAKGAARKVFCSEETADEALVSGMPLLYRRTSHYKPRKLYDELREYHGWFRVA